MGGAGRLRIAITADPEIPVPPKEYGGIERIVDLLICGLTEQGHEVTLFAHRESTVRCRLIAWPRSSGFAGLDAAMNALYTAGHVVRGGFDLLHSFGRLGYMALLLPLRIPKIMSYQRAITGRSVRWGSRFSGGSLHFTACSRQMTRPVQDLAPWHIVHNGVSPSRYEFQPAVAADAPLVFLGRVEHIKGAHLAIEVAKRTGRRLVVAGNIPEGDVHRRYFNERILPHIDGDRVTYAGPVGDAEKNRLLGRAAALLMPILWDEPFGIVMAEALACGTPVIALDRGAVPEVVEHGINGFVCQNVDELTEAAERATAIDRSQCRRVMEERFSGPVMVGGYLNLYRALLEKERAR